jgi:LuxR family transcriptional regulator, maltose regulon positive regulatory protein
VLPATGSTRAHSFALEAVARDAQLDHDAAGAALERALDLAEPRGLRRPFLDVGPALRPILRRHLRRQTAHRALAGELLDALEGARPAPATAEPLLDPLSDRELTVLRYLPTMMSNAEIAGELFVSVNTVKTHLKQIYRKLDVTGRRDAVHRARDLELLAPGHGDG